MADVVFQQRSEEPPRQDLSDGGHLYLECSNCRAVLVDLWVTRPDVPFEAKVRANCPWCEADHETAHLGGSFLRDIKGLFHFAGASHPGGTSHDAFASTEVDGYDEDGQGNLLFTVRKARDGKPLYRRGG